MSSSWLLDFVKKFLPYIFVFLLYLGFHMLMLSNVENIGESFYSNRIENNKLNPKVYDIFHKYLPDLSKYEWISNLYWVIISVILFSYIDLDGIIEFFSYFIVLFIIRDISINLTILPKNKKCYENSIFGGCYDKIFSGHFASIYLLTLIVSKYNIVSPVVLVIINIINAFLILLTRGHYTIDIFVSFFITSLLFTNNIKIPKLI